jgi:peptidoglycan/LPS O-acetylase OafA/YrhL
MGVLRCYLAFCVVAAHASASIAPWMLGSTEAVQIFFIISGFYMQLVLSRKYTGIAQFYESRALRIYAPYYLTLFLVVAVSAASGLLGGKWLALQAYAGHPFSANDPLAFLLAAASNLTIFGQDLTLFLNGAPGEFLRFRQAAPTAPGLCTYLIIPQSWTIALELTFYLVAPFLARWSTAKLILLLGASLALRFIGLLVFGLGHDPWLYRLFPFELALFLAGMLACRWYLTRPTAIARGSTGGWVAIVLTIAALTVCARLLPDHSASPGELAVLLCFYGLVAAGIALLFSCTERNSADRNLGELSYPIYLNHYIFVQFFAAYGFPSLIPRFLTGESVMVLSLVFAVFFNRVFLKPFEAWRHRLLHVTP